MEFAKRLVVEVEACLELSATKVSSMRLRAEYFSTTGKNPDQICVLRLARAVSDIVLRWPKLIVCRTLVITVHHSHLSAIHLHSVAGEGVDYQEFLVRVCFDLLRDSSSDCVDSCDSGIDQSPHIVD